MSPARLRIGIVGGAGRMGQRLLHLLADHPRAAAVAALVHRRPIALPAASAAAIVHSPEALAARSDVVVDFSAPPVACALLPACAQAGVPMVVASTALGAAATADIERAASQLPILLAANLSVGIAVLGELVRAAAAALPLFDVEIVEAHHRQKRDAPSGTALYLFERARAARAEFAPHLGRSGDDALRAPGEVGLHAVRGGDVAGEHQVLLLGDGERLELGHRSHDRDVFARGAIVAAHWLHGRTPGVYSMRDVVASAGGDVSGKRDAAPAMSPAFAPAAAPARPAG